MDIPEIKKFDSWGFIKKNPLMYYPIVIVISTAIASIFFVEDPLLNDLLRMVTWIAIGTQWIGFDRNRQKRKIEQVEIDGDLLKRYAELSQMTGESVVRFLVPYHGKFISRTWNKMRNRTILSLYAPKSLDGLCSFTKLYATKKEMFELKLKGCINTDDGDLALKGLQCLAKGK